MNACVADVENVVELVPRVPGRELSWIEAAFADWGKWIWERRDFEGYPTADAIHAFIHGAGGSSLEHKVLCKDMPKWVTFVHGIWLMLPEHEGIAVYAEYVPCVGDDGKIWTRQAKCQAIGISDEAFRKRLERARFRIWKWSQDRRRN